MRLLLRSLPTLEELSPVALRDLDPELLRRLDDALPCPISLRVGHVLDLIETRDRVANVTRVDDRLLPLLGEGEVLVVEPVPLRGGQRSMLLRGGLLLGALLLRLRGHAPVMPRHREPETSSPVEHEARSREHGRHDLAACSFERHDRAAHDLLRSVVAARSRHGAGRLGPSRSCPRRRRVRRRAR